MESEIEGILVKKISNKEIEKIQNNKIKAVAIFPVINPEKKDDQGSESLNEDNLVCTAIKQIKKNSEYVGDQFPEEARKIHYNEAEMRSIYGKASKTEITELVDEGIDIIQIPEIPDDKN